MDFKYFIRAVVNLDVMGRWSSCFRGTEAVGSIPTTWNFLGSAVSDLLKGSKNRKIVTSVQKLTLTGEKNVQIDSGV